MNKVYKITDDEFTRLVETNASYSDVLRKLGLSPKGGTSSKLLKRRISELGICTNHFENNSTRAQEATRKKLADILVENSTYTNISRLKIRLVKELNFPYVCTKCGNTGEWLNKKLVLQLDHINGVHDDHRIQNLRFLCPNCHSQTETFSGRNR
jgi:5-methylcytosine-specific restriction endonuclease McrA